MTRRVLVAGIGNIFLGDDGFGVEVVRRLASDSLPEGVTVRDFGIRGLHLAYELLDPPSLLVVVDAVNRADPPGTVTVCCPQVDNVESAGDGHGVDLPSVLATLRVMGGQVPRTVLVGCEPAVISEGIGLSEVVEAAVGPAMKAVLDTIRLEARSAGSGAQARELS